MSNKVIAKTLKLAADLMEIKGENGFKIGSYLKAARAIETLGQPVEDFARKGLLGEIQGIGSSTKGAIQEILETGTFAELDRLQREVPVGIQQMLKIKGIGPKKIQFFWLAKGWESIEDLYYACVENRLADEKGFGIKTQTAIKESIEFIQNNAGKFHYGRIFPFAQWLIAQLHTHFADTQIEFFGAIRRKSDIIERIEILIEQTNLQNTVVGFLADLFPIEGTQQEQGRFVCIEAAHHYNIELRFTDSFVWDMFVLTGPETHIQELGVSTEHPLHVTHEVEIYQGANFPYILPELREVPDILHKHTDNLIQLQDIRGVIHAHSTHSDGGSSIKDMASACQKLGYEYLVISDHSQSAFYANGLTEGRLEIQHQEIDKLNAKSPDFKIFKSIESDILYEGGLDYPDEILDSFDCVIASVHAHLKMDEAKATQRLLTAIENPFTDILGHPTGRLLLMRAGYPIDHLRIIDACAANDVAIEINANPYRLDIDWKWVEYAWKKGVLIAVNPDAHSIEGIEDIQWGINVARKGLLPPEMCLNTKSRTEFEAWCKR